MKAKFTPAHGTNQIEVDVSENVNITIKISNTEDIAPFALYILNYKLHSKGDSSLKNICKVCVLKAPNKTKFTWVRHNVKHTRPRFIVGLAYNENNIPIGCVLINGFQINFYVEEKYRNLGIASKLFQAASEKYDLSSKILNYGTSKGALALIKKFNFGTKISELNNKITNS